MKISIINKLMVFISLISLTQAMHSPINTNSTNSQARLIGLNLNGNQNYVLAITIKQLAKCQKLDIYELAKECKHFQKTHARLPLIRETIDIACNLKKQYTRQDELSIEIMSHLFNDYEDEIQSPKLDGYERTDAIISHLDI